MRMELLPNQSHGHSRPTISLALIAKDEEKNINRLLDSVEGCFDEIVLVDTGSTDKTKEIALSRGLMVFDFPWVDSFSKARNFAFSKVTKDFVMWLDLDDVLHNKEAFIHWRNHAMEFVDAWFATYDYAVDQDLKPVVSFVRERVFRAKINPLWQYDLHEGIIVKPEWTKNYITTWRVKHLRSQEDVIKDRSRNITLLEKILKKNTLDARMQFYYGKELYEAGRATEAIPAFEKAFEMPNLELHDRTLGLQYAAYASLACLDQIKPEFAESRRRYFELSIGFALQGIKLEPNRAEFHIIMADSYLRIGNIASAVPYFAAAKACLKNFETPYSDAIYSFKNLYGEAPSLQLAKIYAHLGLLDKAKKEALECIAAYNNEEAKVVLQEVERVSMLVQVKNNQAQTEDIVITTPPQTAYPFDEEIYKTKPLGGSETALVQMARLLKEKTGRRVLVFNMRDEDLVAESGVEYVSNRTVADYFSRFKPRVHIAWRHNIKLTDAFTYLWCHDLCTPTVESHHNFDKFLALSNFHKNYTMGLHGVPEDKIIVTKNGIDPDKFNFKKRKKNPNKIVWLSSPDRGLDRAIAIMDEVKRVLPDVELHVYYGIENLYKYGPDMSALADRLKQMMSERDYVKYHGFTEQSKMYSEVSDAVVWCHPNNFIETYAITAIECLSNGIFPVVRKLGALADTLREAHRSGQAILLEYDWDDPNAVQIHADAVCEAIRERKWERLNGYDITQHDWAKVADSWIDFMGLKEAMGASA